MLNTYLLSLAIALWGCGGSSDDEPVATISINVSQESISAPDNGGTYTVNVTTTGKEWGAYAEGDFITLNTKNTIAQSGSITVIIPANPTTNERKGSITVMSGTARKSITVTQAAAAKSAYNAPEGYSLVWQDEFDKGSQLNADDWTHEVKNAGWVNNELQNYVTDRGRHQGQGRPPRRPEGERHHRQADPRRRRPERLPRFRAGDRSRAGASRGARHLRAAARLHQRGVKTSEKRLCLFLKRVSLRSPRVLRTQTGREGKN